MLADALSEALDLLQSVKHGAFLDLFQRVALELAWHVAF
jgi:hypothetical protein